MTAISKKVRRDVIPRWRILGAGSRSRSGPLAPQQSVSPPTTGAQLMPSSLLEEFDLTGKPLVAVEALSTAISQGNEAIARDAAQRLAHFDLAQRPILQRMVKRITERGHVARSEAIHDAQDAKKLVRSYKRIVRTYPASALAWLNLAFSYTSIGELGQASNAIKAAVSLDPNQRSVARAASRFFVHTGDFDRALYVLERTATAKTDPWMLSAHIATARAAGFSSGLIRLGRQVFKGADLRPDQISELGVALATNEVEHGNIKLARRMLDRALIAPTENAVAQVGWLETIGGLDLAAASFASALPEAWEARTFEAYEQEDWAGSCGEARLWLEDQPFSSRPAVHGSYVASTFLQDYELALRFAERGYIANPGDAVMANNYAVALAQTGDLRRAKIALADAFRYTDAVWRPTLEATKGLIAYKEGLLDEARGSYDRARAFFAARQDVRGQLLACIYQAREESFLGGIGDLRSALRELVSIAENQPKDVKGLKSLATGLIG